MNQISRNIPRISTLFQGRTFGARPEIEEEYFEEHLETSGEIEEEVKKSDFEQSFVPSTSKLADVVGALMAQKARDLVVVKVAEKTMSPYDYRIICSTYNSRQASAILENLRSLMKIDGNTPTAQTRTITKKSNGWYVGETEQIQIHVMNEECREKYALEEFWVGDEKAREAIEMETDSMMLPPKRKAPADN